MNLKMSCLHLKKIDVDNHDKLKSHLNQAKTWAIHQFIKDENGIDQGLKELFSQIPSTLVVDFFASNSIDELNQGICRIPEPLLQEMISNSVSSSVASAIFVFFRSSEFRVQEELVTKSL